MTDLKIGDKVYHTVKGSGEIVGFRYNVFESKDGEHKELRFVRINCGDGFKSVSPGFAKTLKDAYDKREADRIAAITFPDSVKLGTRIPVLDTWVNGHPLLGTVVEHEIQWLTGVPTLYVLVNTPYENKRRITLNAALEGLKLGRAAAPRPWTFDFESTYTGRLYEQPCKYPMYVPPCTIFTLPEDEDKPMWEKVYSDYITKNAADLARQGVCMRTNKNGKEMFRRAFKQQTQSDITGVIVGPDFGVDQLSALAKRMGFALLRQGDETYVQGYYTLDKVNGSRYTRNSNDSAPQWVQDFQKKYGINPG